MYTVGAQFWLSWEQLGAARFCSGLANTVPRRDEKRKNCIVKMFVRCRSTFTEKWLALLTLKEEKQQEKAYKGQMELSPQLYTSLYGVLIVARGISARMRTVQSHRQVRGGASHIPPRGQPRAATRGEESSLILHLVVRDLVSSVSRTNWSHRRNLMGAYSFAWTRHVL